MESHVDLEGCLSRQYSVLSAGITDAQCEQVAGISPLNIAENMGCRHAAAIIAFAVSLV
jgi:hypothetical protein